MAGSACPLCQDCHPTTFYRLGVLISGKRYTTHPGGKGQPPNRAIFRRIALESLLVEGLGRTVLLLGLIGVALGGVLLLAERGGFRLPGDVVLSGKRWKVYLPLGTSLLLSCLGSLLLWLFTRRR